MRDKSCGRRPPRFCLTLAARKTLAVSEARAGARTCQRVRVVKEADLKSAGFDRAGSNPVVDDARPGRGAVRCFFALARARPLLSAAFAAYAPRGEMGAGEWMAFAEDAGFVRPGVGPTREDARLCFLW